MERSARRGKGAKQAPCEAEEHAQRALRARPARSAYKRVAAWFLAAGAPVRLKMLLLLLDAELAIPQLARIMNADSGMVSRQLAVLRGAGLVMMIRHGRQVAYRAARGAEVERFMHLIVAFTNPHLQNS